MRPTPPDTPPELRLLLSRYYSEKIEQMLRAQMRAEQWEALGEPAAIGALVVLAWLFCAWIV